MSRRSSRNQKIGVILALAAGMALAAGGAPAQKAFSGADAAHVDWAWKNCGVEATPKERGLVTETVKTTGDKFQKTYEQEYNSVLAKTGEPAAMRRMCETIKDWYGAGGSRIEGLVAVKGSRPEDSGKSIGRPATSPKNGGGKGGGGGGRHGGL